MNEVAEIPFEERALEIALSDGFISGISYFRNMLVGLMLLSSIIEVYRRLHPLLQPNPTDDSKKRMIREGIKNHLVAELRRQGYKIGKFRLGPNGRIQVEAYGHIYVQDRNKRVMFPKRPHAGQVVIFSTRRAKRIGENMHATCFIWVGNR